MKIVILTSGILPVPAVQGGAVENLIDYYLEYNNIHKLHDITVYSVWHPDVMRHKALKSKINHYKFIDTTSPWAKIKRHYYHKKHAHEYYNYFIEYFFEEVYKDLQKQDYDFIILENRPGYAYKLITRGCKNIILHLHNDLLNNQTPKHQEIYNSLTKILTVSDYIKKRVSTIAWDSKIQTIYNGIDLNRFSTKAKHPISRAELGLTTDDFIIVFSGRVNKDKGIDKLIEAMLLCKDMTNIKLLIIGSTFFGNATNEDDFTHMLKDKAKSIEKNIVFTGFVPYDKMPSYLQIADVAVIPSVWNDPFPTTVLEAQAMELPIITTRRGGIPEEVTEDNAILLEIDEHFVENLASSILKLYKHPEIRLKMCEASRKNSSFYNNERFAKDFLMSLI